MLQVPVSVFVIIPSYSDILKLPAVGTRHLSIGFLLEAIAVGGAVMSARQKSNGQTQRRTLRNCRSWLTQPLTTWLA